MTLAMESSDADFTAWQQANLARAASEFDVALAGPAVFGWRLRSIGATYPSAQVGIKTPPIKGLDTSEHDVSVARSGT